MSTATLRRYGYPIFYGSITVNFEWHFEDADDRKIVVAITATLIPEKRSIINADPDDCQEGRPAYFKATAIGITRELTDAAASATAAAAATTARATATINKVTSCLTNFPLAAGLALSSNG